VPALTVSWQAGRLMLGDVAASSIVCSADERYDVRIGAGWLIAPAGAGLAGFRVTGTPPTLESAAAHSGTGARPEPVALPAAAGAPALRERIADPSGALLVLGGGALHVLPAAAPGAAWSSYPLPADLTPRCAAMAAGVPWVGGSSASEQRRAQRRDAELVRWSPEAGAFVPAKPRLGFVGAVRAVARDGFAAIEGIEARGMPAVLWASARDPAAAASTLFVVGAGDRWHAIGVPGTVRALHRLNRARVLVVTAEGKLFLLDGRLRRLGAATAINAHALSGAPRGARVIVRGSDAAGGEIALVAGAYTVAVDGLRWHRTVALRARDAGATWTCQRATLPPGGDPELLDIALVA
jgi:hypothetical protein